jgi:mannose-6-phosphate isomerase-like protein (cupin superfamily)
MHYGPALDEVIAGLPELDIPFPGYAAWALDPGKHQMTFVKVEGSDGDVPEHAHGLQIGFLLAGEAVLTVEGEDWHLKAGDSYVVPAGARHKSVPQPGVLAIEIFDEPNRHKLKQS